jgi:flagellar FliL protein
MSTPQSQAAAPAPARSGKKLVILAAGVLVLAGAGVVGYLELGKEPAPAAEGEAVEKPPVVVEPGVVELEPFVLNLADPAGDRYFRMRASIVLDQKAIAARASDGLGQVKLRDRILSLLSKKRASQVTTVEGKELLRTEVQAVVEELFARPPLYVEGSDPAPAHVMDVFFTEFLIQ